MSSIPLPALDIKQQQSDPLESYGRLVQLKSLLQNQQFQQQMQPMQMQQQQQATEAGALDLQQKQRDAADQQVLQQAISASPGATIHDILPQLAGKVSPRSFLAYQKLDRDSQTEYEKLTKDKLENTAAQHQQYQQIYDSVMNIPDDQVQAQWPQIAQAVNSVPGGSIKLDPQQPKSKQELASFGPMLSLGDAYLQKAMARQKEKAEVAETQAKAEQATKVNAGTNALGVTADQAAQLAQGKQRIGLEAAQQAETRRHNKQTEGAITPDALKMAADQFAATGQMPQMGRSTSIRTQIMNQAALDHPKVDLASNAAAYKANASSLKNVTGTLDTLTAFESTGLKNLKQFTDLAEKIPDTGVPWLNTPVRMLNRNMVGDANMAAVEAARNVALREIARVTNDPKLSGTLTDSSRHEVSGLIPQNATFNQIKAVAKVLQQDMANVHQSLEEQRDAIKGRISTSDANGTSQPKQPQPQTQSGGSDFFSQYGGKKLNQ